MQIEISCGRATREEQSFLLSPSQGQRFIVKVLPGYSGPTAEADTDLVQFGKNPFDWMADSRWQMLLVRKP